MLAELTKKEKKVIRKIAKLQLQSLRNLLKNNPELNIQEYCDEYEIDILELRGRIRKEMGEFNRVFEEPGLFFSLPGDSLGIGKTILYNFFWGKKYREVSKAIHRKITVLEMFTEYPKCLN